MVTGGCSFHCLRKHSTVSMVLTTSTRGFYVLLPMQTMMLWTLMYCVAELLGCFWLGWFCHCGYDLAIIGKSYSPDVVPTISTHVQGPRRTTRPGFSIEACFCKDLLSCRAVCTSSSKHANVCSVSACHHLGACVYPGCSGTM